MRADLANYLGVAAPSDFFQLLNLDFGATPMDIRASYRALQRLVHPDLVGALMARGLSQPLYPSLSSGGTPWRQEATEWASANLDLGDMHA